MKIVGYSDRLSVAMGEKIQFMVSCELPSYQADIVRLIHGDPNPPGPGFIEEFIETPVGGQYPGRVQDIHTGAYVVIADTPLLRQTVSFTLQAWIYPTTPTKGVQGILTKWSAPDNAGYGLFIDEDGSLSLWIGDGDGKIERLSTDKPMRASDWYFVAASYDAGSGRVNLYQQQVNEWPLDDSSVVVEHSTAIQRIGEGEIPFIMAGYWKGEESGKTIVGGHFNGRIDSPRLFGRALESGEVEALKGDTSPEDLDEALVGAWDFSRDISSSKITDTSSNGLHGWAVNMPMRAATGHNWSGREMNFKHAPNEYGAIHFHDDDLDDAGWEVDFELTVPEGTKGGVYAARLTTDEGEDYIPFYVRPKKGRPSAKIAFLAPTNNYLAYGDEHIEDLPLELLPNQKMELNPDEYRYIADHNLGSIYDLHSDGSGIGYVSRLRPIVNMRPKHIFRNFNCCRHFSADLYLLYWMERAGYDFDVITDEDLHFDGLDLLAPYKVVVTGSHPEYTSESMLVALEDYLQSGGRMMYLGGNGFYWVTSFDPQRPHILEVRKWGGTRTCEPLAGEYYHSTTGELGGIWRNRGKAPQKLVGVGFAAQGFDKNSPYHRKEGSFDPRTAFIFEGVGEDEVIGDFKSPVLNYGAAGDEIDRLDYGLGTPPHALLLASSSGHSDCYQQTVEEAVMIDSRHGGSVSSKVRADMVYFECPNGGAVFSVGSISWNGALSYNDYDNNVSRITENVLKRFVSDEPLP